MEIKEGMYARIDNDFRTICLGIGKIKKIVEDTVYVETTKDRFNGIPISYNKNQIEKASYNLINLIEKGDYVNGVKVTYIDNDNQILRVDGFSWGTNIIENKDIKTIVTHEQFNSMKYEVGE